MTAWSRNDGFICSSFGVVVEIVLDLVLRQPGGRVDLQAQQVTHCVGVFAAVEATQRHVAGVRGRLLRPVERGLEPAHHALYGGVVRQFFFGRRRHQAAAQLLDRGLEDLGFLRHGVGGHGVEGDAAGPVLGVVALEAVGFDQVPLLGVRIARGAGLRAGHRGSRRHRGRDAIAPRPRDTRNRPIRIELIRSSPVCLGAHGNAGRFEPPIILSRQPGKGSVFRGSATAGRA